LPRRIDPMVRLLLAATALAFVLPVTGAAREAMQGIANGAVFVLFLLYGLRLSRAEVWAGLGNHRMLWPLTAWVYLAMPLGGWLLWQAGAGWMPPLLALGFLYLGCLPSTVQSATAYSSLAGGNVASSVVAAALLNILGVFVTAPLFSLLAGQGAAEFHGDGLLKVMGILLLPFIVGQALQQRFGHWVREHRALATAMDRGAIVIAVYVAFSAAVEQRFWEQVGLEGWGWLAGGTAAFLLFGHLGAWLLGRGLGLSRGDRIAMLFAGGQKSIAIGAPLATVLFVPRVAGIVMLPVLVYHLVQLVIAAPIAARLNRT
jgi:sodium/bile acid cotransporter 7